MKKLSILTTLLLSIFIFVACNTPTTSNNIYEQIIEVLEKDAGKSSDKIFSNLKLDKSKDAVVNEHDPNAYDLEESQTLFDEEYTLTICFTNSEPQDKFYGFIYEKTIENIDNGKKIVSSLYKNLVQKYGEPVTYSEMPNTLSEVEDFQVKNIENSHCLDLFEISPTFQIEVVARFVTKEFHKTDKDIMIITIKHINNDPSIFKPNPKNTN